MTVWTRRNRIPSRRKQRPVRLNLEALEVRELLDAGSTLLGDVAQFRHDMTASAIAVVNAAQPSPANTLTPTSIHSQLSKAWTVLAGDWNKIEQAFVQVEYAALGTLQLEFKTLLAGLDKQLGIAPNTNDSSQQSRLGGVGNAATSSGSTHDLATPPPVPPNDSAAAKTKPADTPAAHDPPSLTALTSSVNIPANYGPGTATFTLTATVTGNSGTPTGSVTFYNGTGVLGTATLNSSGVATFTTSALTLGGSFDFSAIYTGNSTYSDSTGSQVYLGFNGTGTLTLTGSFNETDNIATQGLINGNTIDGHFNGHNNNAGPMSATYTGTLNGSSVNGTFSGNITWSPTAHSTMSGTLTGTDSGNSLNLSYSGTYSGSYAGNINASTTSTVASPSSIAVISSSNPSGPGQPVTFEATVTGNSGTPTGSVAFYDGTTPLGTGSLNAKGVANWTTTSPLTTGYHDITAIYSGNTTTPYAGSTTSMLQTVGDPADFVLGSNCNCGCPNEAGSVPQTDANQNATPPDNTDQLVRYADGVVTVAQTALHSSGFGFPWAQTFSWSNGAGYSNGVNGKGWVDTYAPQLIQSDGATNNTLVVVANANTASYFTLVNGVYQASFADTSKLTYNGGDTYTLIDPLGDQIVFNGFGTSWQPAQRGQFQKYIDANGVTLNVTSHTSDGHIAEMQRSVTVGSTTTTDSWLFTYLPSTDANAGLLSNVTLRTQVNSGAWSTVQQIAYSYYDGTQTNGGNLGDLMTATIEDGSNKVLSTSYYRYYTPADINNGKIDYADYADALEYVFTNDSYERLTAALGTNLGSLTDSQVSPYADNYFQYDNQKRVAQETVQGAGDSQAGGKGLGTYSFSYTASNNAAGANNWAMKTVVTNPDASTDTVYTNAYGEVMLDDHNDSAIGDTDEFYEYNAQGQLILDAAPSAITGYSDSSANLSPALNARSGLITSYSYATTTTAGETTAGNVAQYLQEAFIQQGQQGTLIRQESWQYYAHSYNGQTIVPISSEVLFRGNDINSGESPTYYFYDTWYSGTAQVQKQEEHASIISAAENGPGTTDVTTTYFDTFGNVQWVKDPDGYLQYYAYDLATGAPTTQIVDVNTADTGEFTNLPTGWTTPSGGGLNLITTDVVDALGRTTEETSPGGNVTYYVYLDPQHEERIYQGWNSGAPTGPTQVIRADGSGSYTEVLTMTATPHAPNGTPDGTEAISNLQTLTRNYTNSAGQITSEYAYFNLGGLAYNTGTMGTVNVNYYQTNFGYDSNGRLVRTQTPNRTIYRTVYNSLDEAVSDWVGTNDTPTSGEWSPTNNTGTANMVEVASYQYDNGGVGDGNLTQETDYPGLGAPNRVSQFWYDWRDRLVAQKSGVQGSENDGTNRPIIVYTYDNLDEVTETQEYTGDGVTPTISGGVLQALPANDLRAQEIDSYDDQQRVYQAQVYDVNPTNGAVSTTALTTNDYYDHRGDLIAESAPGGLWTKSVYDGAGRDVMDYTSDGGATANISPSWTVASSVTNDIVLEQSQTKYDGDSNPIETIDSQRFHDDTATQLGALGTPTSGIAARVYYAAAYYDNADRLTASVDVGTNHGSAWTRPSTPPAPSATVLVANYGYRADAVQQVSLTGAPTGGTFTLTFAGQTTAAIAYNANAATVQSALQALPNIGANNVLVSGTPGAWRVRFAGSLVGTYQSQLSGNGSGLTGGNSPAVAVATISAGGDAGQLQDVTDPMGIRTESYYDPLGRTTQTVQNYLAGDGTLTAEQNVTTEYGYDGNNNVTYVQADQPGGTYQKTGYLYSVTTAAGDGVNSNDILSAVQHPDPTTGNPSSSQQDSYLVNALGDMVQSTDRNGNVHQFSYDVLGRETSDAVTTLGSGVDGSVRRIQYAYDSQGNGYLTTTYNAASGGSIVNQVQDVFNGLDQLTGDYQSHSGAVNTLSTPEVQYAYTEMSGGQNNSRLTSMTYPKGYVLNFNYNSGLDSNISRLSSLSDVENNVPVTLESYLYLGLDTVVERDHSQNKVNLTYIKQGSDPNANNDGGDQYTGLDRFGRVIDQNWVNATTGTSTDRFQYGYNQDGDVLYKQNLVDAVMSELYQYDNLHQLTNFQRGTLNSTHNGIVGSPSASQSWSPDALGNFTSVTTNGGSPQTRTANQQNEITSIQGQSAPTYDANGNLTADGTGNTFVYDAWNQLITVKNNGTTLATFSYDGLGRRITQTESGTTTDLYYSAADQVLEEDVAGVIQARNVWSVVYVNALVLRDQSSQHNGVLDQRLYVQEDANWNVTALVDTSGNLVERYIYTSYGVQTVLNPSWSVISQSAYNVSYGFQGMRSDSLVSVYFADNRVYDPALMRWLQTDPIGLNAGNNDYAFLGNGPTDAVDPSGLASWVWPWDPSASWNPGDVTKLWFGVRITNPFVEHPIPPGTNLEPVGGTPIPTPEQVNTLTKNILRRGGWSEDEIQQLEIMMFGPVADPNNYTPDGRYVGPLYGVPPLRRIGSVKVRRGIPCKAPKAGETASTATGKSIHKSIADARRAGGELDLVQSPIKDKAGNPILVSKRVDLKSGKPQPGSLLQEAVPDAVSFRRKLILDDKPLGRPIAKDRQEIIRFIKAYEQREGHLPDVIGITRYDPKTGQQVLTELYSPSDFLP